MKKCSILSSLLTLTFLLSSVGIVSAQQGGYGLIDVVVHSFQRIKIPQIRVDFT